MPSRTRKNTMKRRVPRAFGAAGPRRFKAGIVRRAYNPSPVFTETFVLTDGAATPTPIFCGANQGFLLKVNMDMVPERAQYSALYTRYKILGAKFMLLPRFSAGSSDENAVNYNNGSSQPWVTDARIVYSIQDSPNQGVPPSEQAVLEDNGCRVRMVKNKLVIRTRPVPDLQLANGVYETVVNNPYLNFDTVGGVAAPFHYGVTGWITQLISGAPPTRQGYDVYCKLTFQLKDPR